MKKHPLKITHIFKSFSDKEILNDINFDVKSGEIFGFIGLNGAGKTTLIKIIIDLLTEDSGIVEIFGKSKILPKSREDIFYLPEKFQPSNYLKGFEFLEFTSGLHNQKIDKKDAKKMAEMLDLDPKSLSLRVSKYSKGMMQKLGLISVFLTSAKLSILDEPMSGLDPRARIFLKKQLISYKNKGNSVFFSSHILSDIDEICNRIAVLNGGRIVFVGTSKEFKKKHNKNDLENAFLSEIM